VDLWEPRVAEQEITCKGGATVTAKGIHDSNIPESTHERPSSTPLN
jgi:hypothetical protein